MMFFVGGSLIELKHAGIVYSSVEDNEVSTRKVQFSIARETRTHNPSDLTLRDSRVSSRQL